jgi:hypothetical protein
MGNKVCSRKHLTVSSPRVPKRVYILATPTAFMEDVSVGAHKGKCHYDELDGRCIKAREARRQTKTYADLNIAKTNAELEEDDSDSDEEVDYGITTMVADSDDDEDDEMTLRDDVAGDDDDDDGEAGDGSSESEDDEADGQGTGRGTSGKRGGPTMKMQPDPKKRKTNGGPNMCVYTSRLTQLSIPNHKTFQFFAQGEEVHDRPEVPGNDSTLKPKKSRQEFHQESDP